MFSRLNLALMGIVGTFIIGLLTKLKIGKYKQDKLEQENLNQKDEIEQANKNLIIQGNTIENLNEVKNITESVANNSDAANRELLKQFTKDGVR